MSCDRPISSLLPLTQIPSERIGEAERERDDREGRICARTCRKDRAPSNEKIIYTVYSTVTINDPLAWIIVHPCCPEMVTSSLHLLWETGGAIKSDPEAAET